MADAVLHSHDPQQVSFLSQADASAVDEVLMGSLGFSIDQLMVRPFLLFSFGPRI